MDDAVFTCAAGHTDRIFGCNRTGETISAFTPVEILTASRSRQSAENPQHVPYLLRKISRTTTCIGVTLRDIPHNNWGEVQISGLARCTIAETAQTPKFAVAGDGELVAASCGWPVFTITSPQKITFVLLGGCCDRYVGTFAVEKRSDGFYCYDSAHPDSETAGTTDIGDVPAGTITAVNGRFSLYLWYENESYHQSFTKPATGSCGVVTLAELSGTEPRQCWTQGVIHWAQWYLL